MKKIKVLHIIKTLGLGGAETNLLNLVLSTDQNRFDLHVAYSFGGEIEKRFRDAGVNLFKYADADHRVKSLATLSIIKKLTSYVLKNKIQIIHTHTFSAHIWGSITAKLTGCKVIEHVHDFRYLNPDDFKRRRGTSNQYKFINYFKNISDRVVVLTKQNQEFLIKNNLYSANRIREYQNGIPLEESVPGSYKEEVIKKFALSPNALIVLTPVRFAPEKNVDLILRIAPKVSAHIPNVVFLIAGDGPLIKQTSEEIIKLDMEKHIKLIGYHSNITSLLQAADIFLLPSFLELHSIAILEAMSMKVPIVTSQDVGCNSEFIENGKNGYLLDPFIDEGWDSALINLLKNPALSKQVGEEGFKTCKKLFDIKNVVKKFESLYAELISF
jgi:glycosyltransferase involved in cell wall biosynthesis